MLKLVLAAAIFLCLIPSKGHAWQLQNLSDETRVFDEYHELKGNPTPYTKTAKPGGTLSFVNTPRITVVDRKTGQQISNPNFKMMVVTKEGALRVR